MLWMLLAAVFLLLREAEVKQLFISYSTERESMQLFKYFHNSFREFFVDVGAYDPIYASNTVNLLGWSGINIEACTKRHRNFLVSRPNQINLNVAISNVTGGYAKLVEYAEDSSASINADFLKTNANPSLNPLQEKVQQMTLGDLCHQYYPKRPKLMNVDIEGHGLVALQSNDWSDLKCIPQIIIVEHIQDEEKNKMQRKILVDNQYSFQKSSQLNEIYVHRPLLEEYKRKNEEGNKKLVNIREKYWFPIYQALFKRIIPTYNTDFQNFRHIDPRNSPIFLHFASQKIIFIEKLNRQKKSLSTTSRPILILHYNSLKSKLFLGSNQFKVTEIEFEDERMSYLEISYPGQKVDVYVLDHQIPDSNPLNIIDQARVIPCKEHKIVFQHKKDMQSDGK